MRWIGWIALLAGCAPGPERVWTEARVLTPTGFPTWDADPPTPASFQLRFTSSDFDYDPIFGDVTGWAVVSDVFEDVEPADMPLVWDLSADVLRVDAVPAANFLVHILYTGDGSSADVDVSAPGDDETMVSYTAADDAWGSFPVELAWEERVIDE